MSVKIFFSIFLLFFKWGTTYAQVFSFTYDNSPIINWQGNNLPNAWAGGLNASQFSKIDLNMDGLEDLTIFDRTTSKLSCFLTTNTNGNYNYQYAPEYQTLFPELYGWVLLRDYDGDGDKDIFTHSNLGIKVYQNNTLPNQPLQFDLLVDPVMTTGFSDNMLNLQVSATDIPSILDVDHDGDLDILCYDFTGAYIEFHQNKSIEKYGNANTLEFKRINNCWGDFHEGHTCGAYTFGIDCEQNNNKVIPKQEIDDSKTNKTLHVGSTLTVLDANGDGIQDILVGEILCSDVHLLINEGTNEKAVFTKIHADYPADKPINLPTFPAVFLEDVDFDGKNDLITSPNVFINEGNSIDFKSCNWFYKNIGTNEIPEFIFQQPNFMQNSMLDIGENAYPALFDYDGDSDLDMLIGKRSNGAGDWANLTLLENTGDVQNPVFKWVTDDFLALSQLQSVNLKPLILDINRDGANDLTWVSTVGNIVQFQYVLNGAPKNAPVAFDFNKRKIMDLPIAVEDNPLLYDTDKDGDWDLLVGRRLGNLAYYKNQGNNATPNFVLENESWGGIDDDPTARNLALTIADWNSDGKMDLLTTDKNGKPNIYADFINLGTVWEGSTEVIYQEITQKYTSPALGGALYPTLGDLNADGSPDLLIGTQAGGVTYFRNLIPNNQVGENPDDILIYPNPSARYFYIKSPVNAEAEVWNIWGQKLVTNFSLKPYQEATLDLKNLPVGVYFLKIANAQNIWTKRVLIVE